MDEDILEQSMEEIDYLEEAASPFIGYAGENILEEIVEELIIAVLL